MACSGSLADYVRAGEVVEEAADAAPADHAVRAVIDFGVDGDGEFLGIGGLYYVFKMRLGMPKRHLTLP